MTTDVVADDVETVSAEELCQRVGQVRSADVEPARDLPLLKWRGRCERIGQP